MSNDLPVPNSSTAAKPAPGSLESLPGFALPHSALKSIPLPVEFLAVVDDAQKANQVRSFLPKFFNPLFRKQGVVNKLSLQALNKVGDSLRQLAEEIGTRDRLIEKLAEHINAQSTSNQLQHSRILEFCQQLERHLGTVAASAQSTDAQILGTTATMQDEIKSLVRAIQIDEGSLSYLQGNAVTMEAKATAIEAAQRADHQHLKQELASVKAQLSGLASVTSLLDARQAETDSVLAAIQQSGAHTLQLAQASEQRLNLTQGSLASLQQLIADREPAFSAMAERLRDIAAGEEALKQRLAESESRYQTGLTELTQSLAEARLAHTANTQQAQKEASALRSDLEQHLAVVERRHQAEIAQVARSLAGERHSLNELSRQVPESAAALRASFEQQLARLEAQHLAEAAAYNTELTELRSRLAVVQHDQGTFLKRWETALDGATRKAAKNASEPSRTEKASTHLAREKQREFDALYLAFENRFRGSRELIKERLKPNVDLLTRILPVIQRTPGIRWPDRPGSTTYPIIDLGCGRGEWLEIISQCGQRALGVDLNVYFLTECRERGLAVAESDAIAFLKGLPDSSLAMVSGFHIIEHLPLPALLDLVTETFRVLVKGGTALFETPNCKNLTVGAANFYCDPTHQHPVFPDTAQFLFKHAGFSEARIDYRLPVDGSPFDQTKPDQSALHGWFYGPRDYAVIATK